MSTTYKRCAECTEWFPKEEHDYLCAAHRIALIFRENKRRSKERLRDPHLSCPKELKEAIKMLAVQENKDLSRMTRTILIMGIEAFIEKRHEQTKDSSNS